MKRYFLIFFLLAGCQSTSSKNYSASAKQTVPDDVYYISICNFSLYNDDDCVNKVQQNISREKIRRVKVLKALESRYKNNFKTFEEIFYASYPAVNSTGQDVPYNLFVLAEVIPPTSTENAVFVFRNNSYDYGLLWSPSDRPSYRKSKIGTPLPKFVSCSVMYSIPKLVSLKYYSLFSVPCD